MINLTINTDASFWPHKGNDFGASGYAFWIVCDLFVIKKSGKFKTTATTSTDAEMKCIANSICTLLAQKELPKVKLLIINTDSLESIRLIKTDKKGLGCKVSNMLYRLLVKTECVKFEFRHVKAHSGIKDKRSYVNEWCDKEAKRFMRLHRKQLKNTGELTQ